MKHSIESVHRKLSSAQYSKSLKDFESMSDFQRINEIHEFLRSRLDKGKLNDAQEIAKLLDRPLSRRELEKCLVGCQNNGRFHNATIIMKSLGRTFTTKELIAFRSTGTEKELHENVKAINEFL